MLRQKNHLTSELVEEEPVVLVLTEEKTPLLVKLLAFLNQQRVKVKTCLFSDFSNDSQALEIFQELKQSSIYKVLVLAGWQKKYVKNYSVLSNVLTALGRGFNEDGRILPFFFLLNYSSPLKFLDNDFLELNSYWQEQERFLSQMIKKFPLASYCLLEDFVEKDVFCPRFNLLFAGFSENLMMDIGQDCYWQDFDGLMENFARLFFQSQGAGKYLLRGKKTAGVITIANYKNKLEQYFRRDFQAWIIQTELSSQAAYLADFVTLYGKGGLVEKSLDDLVRLLPRSLMLKYELKTSVLGNSKGTKSVVNMTNEIVPELIKKESVNKQKKELSSFSTELGEKKLSPTPHLSKKTSQNPESNQKSVKLGDQQLANIFQDKQQRRQEDRFEKNLHEAKTIVKKNRHRKLMFYVGISIFSIGSVIFFLFISFFLSHSYLKNKLFAGLGQGNWLENQQLANLNKGLIYNSFSWQLKQYQQLLGDDQLAEAGNNPQLFNHKAQIYNLKKNLKNERFALFQMILKTEGEMGEAFAQYLNLVSDLYEERRLLNQALDSLNFDNFAEDRATSLKQLKSDNLRLLKTQQRSLSLIKPLFNILSGPARSNLVILIQDNSELRSSGGLLSNLLFFSF